MNEAQWYTSPILRHNHHHHHHRKCTQIRVILDQIRGRTYEDALMILEYMPHRACEPILKLLVSVRGVHTICTVHDMSAADVVLLTSIPGRLLLLLWKRRLLPMQSKTWVCARASWL